MLLKYKLYNILYNIILNTLMDKLELYEKNLLEINIKLEANEIQREYLIKQHQLLVIKIIEERKIQRNTTDKMLKKR